MAAYCLTEPSSGSDASVSPAYIHIQLSEIFLSHSVSKFSRMWEIYDHLRGSGKNFVNSVGNIWSLNVIIMKSQFLNRSLYVWRSDVVTLHIDIYIAAMICELASFVIIFL